MGTGRLSAGWIVFGVMAATLGVGCGKTAHEGEVVEEGGATSSPSPFGGSASAIGGSAEVGNVGASGEGGSGGRGGSGNEQGPDDQEGLGRPLGSEEATLQPAGCSEALADECEEETSEGATRLVTLPTRPWAFDATAEQQVFAACRTVYLQPRGGCVRPLGVTESSIRSVAIVGASYAVVQSESIRVVDADGIVRAAWESPRGSVWHSSVPPVVVSGEVIDFFASDELHELDPRSGETRKLASNPDQDVGTLLAVGDDLVWSVGIRTTSSVPTFTPTSVRRFVRRSGKVVIESELPCESLGTDGTYLYCTTWHHFERWRPGEPPEADPLEEDGGELLFGPGLLARGTSLYLPADPATPVGMLEAPPFRIAAGSAYYQLADDPQERFSLYRSTIEQK